MPFFPADLRRLHGDPYFRRGVRDMLAFAPGIVAWGLVSGVAMTQSGLGVGLATLMSLTVYAGSAQLASLPLIAAGAPVAVIWASATCINLRFVLFSAQWRAYLGGLSRGRRLALGYFLADLNLIAFQRGWPDAEPAAGQPRYIAGSAACGWLMWQGASLAGIFASSFVPVRWGLGFAGTLAMLGIAYSLLLDRTAIVAATVAAAAAVAAFALPLKLNIVVAIAAAVAAGLLMERAGRAALRLGGRA